jgi:hypothetical protein
MSHDVRPTEGLGAPDRKKARPPTNGLPGFSDGCSTPTSGHRGGKAGRLQWADAVEKVVRDYRRIVIPSR